MLSSYINFFFSNLKDLKNIANRMANLVNADLDAISVVKKGWRQQFYEAMNVNGGDVENAKLIDYVMHFFSFPWKVKNSLFQFIFDQDTKNVENFHLIHQFTLKNKKKI